MAKFHHILKILLLDIFQTEHFALRLQVYLWFPEFLKLEWEAEPSVIRPLSCETSFQFGFRKQTPSLTLRLCLKLSFLKKLWGSCSLGRRAVAYQSEGQWLDFRLPLATCLSILEQDTEPHIAIHQSVNECVE